MLASVSAGPERVLVLAPTAKDAALTRSIRAEADLICEVCESPRAAAREIGAGAGAVLVTDELVSDNEIGALLVALDAQPAWSDIPIVMLSGAGADSAAAAQ